MRKLHTDGVKMQNYSVLMSVYYKEKPEYLRQAIESIQVQTFPTDDFVLVCDGPLNDALDAVIAAKQREMGSALNVVRLTRNSGLGDALNKGIKIAKTNWLRGWIVMTSVQRSLREAGQAIREKSRIRYSKRCTFGICY